MSEYQYYEFQAIDEPLTQRAMAELRAITSRATITPTSLVNVYHFGDFKGDPDRLMDQYFDAHLYVANWGTRQFMLRLPAGAFDLTDAKPYCVPYVLQARANKGHVILDFHSDSEKGDEDFEGGEGWLASLIPLRSDLLAGDVRCLYLSWLAGVQNGEVKEKRPEPAVPPGLGRLSAPLRRFADFLRVDPNLIEVAAAASEEVAPGGPSAGELAAWVGRLPLTEKDAVLVRLMQGEGVPLARELLGRFRKDQAGAGPSEVVNEARRTAGDLIEARDRLAEERRVRASQRAAKEKAQRARQLAEARGRHLDALAGRQEEAWQEVEAAIKTRQPKEYDRAVELLNDLRDLAEREGSGEAVAERLQDLRQRHGSKPTLVKRLDRAGLPK